MKVRGDDSAVARYFDGRDQPPPQPSPAMTPRGGVLDTLGLPQPANTMQPRNPLMQGLDIMGQAAGVADYYAMGIPSSLAGLVNAAIPGQPLGGLSEARRASDDAQSAAARTSLGRDALALPQAFAGFGPYSISTKGIPSSGASASAQNAANPPRGTMQGVPSVYQKPQDYFPNEIQRPSGPPPVPATTRRQDAAAFGGEMAYRDAMQGDTRLADFLHRIEGHGPTSRWRDAETRKFVKSVYGDMSQDFQSRVLNYLRDNPSMQSLRAKKPTAND
jgi:hypothetical protein